MTNEEQAERIVALEERVRALERELRMRILRRPPDEEDVRVIDTALWTSVGRVEQDAGREQIIGDIEQ